MLLRIISGIRKSELLVIYLYKRIFQNWFELVASGSAIELLLPVINLEAIFYEIRKDGPQGALVSVVGFSEMKEWG